MALAAAFYGNWIVMLRVKSQGGAVWPKELCKVWSQVQAQFPYNPKGFTWHKKSCAFFFSIVFPGIHSMFHRKKTMTSFLKM
jgi:hypothetical protein